LSVSIRFRSFSTPVHEVAARKAARSADALGDICSLRRLSLARGSSVSYSRRPLFADASIAASRAPTQFGKLIAEETEKWGKVIRAANIKAE
jgi:hypothetical protein